MMDTFVTVFANCLVTRAPDPSPVLATYLGTLTPTDKAREREVLLLALNRHEWNISRVARDLGLSRRTIYLRLQKHRIERRRVSKARTPRSEPEPA
jgi:transcriptional regulator of acetoin/glycerol metabolism